jgi:hypothetical protein
MGWVRPVPSWLRVGTRVAQSGQLEAGVPGKIGHAERRASDRRLPVYQPTGFPAPPACRPHGEAGNLENR